MADPLSRLLERLDLEPLDRDLFLGQPGQGEGRLFGGFVAAQAVMAAGRTVESGYLHSLHAYFLRPGTHAVPITYLVHRIRDGRTFTTRRVVASQGGEAIFNLAASFTRPEEGIEHQEPMPVVPGPEELPDWDEERARRAGNANGELSPVELRIVDPDDPEGRPMPPTKHVWIRPRGRLPADGLLHTALLAYASDRVLLSTAARPHAIPPGRRFAASLDHVMWLHHPARFDDWLLYAMHSPAAHAARAIVIGGMYRREGTRVATVAQEALIRTPGGA